jgi:hypothetical protein
VKKLGLATGQVGHAKMTVNGKGPNLHMPTLGLTLPVRAQLRRSDAQTCWEATYDGNVKKNDGSTFKVKSD